MNFPTVAQVKAHIRVEIDDEEDDLIQEYIESAILAISRYINQKIYENEVPPEESNGTIFDVTMRHALYLIVGEWYRYRENTSTSDMHELPNGVKQLLGPIRKRNA